MLVLAIVIWAILIVVTSYGVQHLWAPATRNRFLVILMAPGVIVHEVSHVVACLLTGATVKEVSLTNAGVAGQVEHTRPVVPILGQGLISLAPLIGCGACLWLATNTDVLQPATEALSNGRQPAAVVTEPKAFVNYLADVLDETWSAVQAADFQDWRTYALLYVALLMAIHMSPSQRDLRNGFLSIAVLGVGAFAVAYFRPAWVATPLRDIWPFLTLCLALSLSLLLVTLFFFGVVRFVKLMIGKQV